MAAQAGPRLTVWYDGACPLCIREIALMRRLDQRGALGFVDLTAAEPAACPLDRSLLLARFHVRTREGRLLDGAAAFAAVWREIPLLWPLAAVARLPGALWLLERLYRRFLAARPRMQAWARKL